MALKELFPVAQAEEGFGAHARRGGKPTGIISPTKQKGARLPSKLPRHVRFLEPVVMVNPAALAMLPAQRHLAHMGPPSKAPKAVTTSFSSNFDSLTRPVQLFCLACGVFLFFGTSSCLQEALIRMDGFKPYAWALAVFEMAGIFASTAAERHFRGENDRRASWRIYALLTLFLASSSSLSTIALRYINFPTKIVGRSCKLLPTLAVAVLWNRRQLRGREVLAAAAVSLGLVFFALGDKSVSPDFDVRGIILVMLSVCADAMLPNLQERAFAEGATRSEMMFYTNFCTMVAMSFTVGLTGGLWPAMVFVAQNPRALCYIVVLLLVQYAAIFCHMHLVKRFGGVTTVFVGSTRKACTIVLSFILFKKPFAPLYVVAGALVLAGLLCNALGQRSSSSSSASKKRRRSSKAAERNVKMGALGKGLVVLVGTPGPCKPLLEQNEELRTAPSTPVHEEVDVELVGAYRC